ncbi:MAG: SAF domain-containing protein [Acidimicrobiia bacterium]
MTATPRTAPQNGHQPTRPVPLVRQRNLTRIAIGVVVLALSTLGVVSLRSNNSVTRSRLVVTRTVASGERIEANDVRTIQVPATLDADLVPAADINRVVGRTARTTLIDRSLLSPGQLARADTQSGTAVVGATLKAGQFPTTLGIGDRVLVVATSDNPDNLDSGATSSTRAVVVDLVEQTTDSQSTIVSLRVRVEAAPTVAAAGASGHVSLVSVGP